MPNCAYGAWEGRGAGAKGLGQGMGPRIREDNGWGRDGFPQSRLHWGRLYAGMTSGCENDGLGARMGGRGEGDGSPHPRGQRMGKGWIPAKNENENRIGLSPSSLRGEGKRQALRGNNGSGCGNDGLGARMGGGGRGWVPASARTTDGEGMDSRPRLHGGRLFAGRGRGGVAGRATTRVAPTEKGIKGKGILCWG